MIKMANNILKIHSLQGFDNLVLLFDNFGDFEKLHITFSQL